MSFFKELNINYRCGSKKFYSGRKSQFKNLYWHQKLEFSNIEKFQKNLCNTIGLIGYVCDEGVKRNQGRIGARKGPKSIRNSLGKIPVHFIDKKIIDYGDLICVGNDLEDCQKALSLSIKKLINNKIFPISLGGGHDIAIANFNGIKDAISNTPKNKIGIINFDAHFDLRTVETKPNSGTPFNQILNKNKTTSYFAIGIQKQSNDRNLFKIANQLKVSYVSNFECETFTSSLQKKLIDFIDKVDYLYLTIDLDGFSSAYAPGVSAPSPLGFNPSFVFKALDFILMSKKLISCDIAELNPDFDIDNKTSVLAARLLDHIIQNLKL